MKRWKIGLVILVFVSLNLAGATISHKIRVKAQHDTQLYELMLSYDAFTFMTTGGDSFGYENYFKWQYAKTLQDPKTPILTKILFWDMGIFYDASNPPQEYDYPPIYDGSWVNLPDMGIVWYPDKLPDGHYTVAKIFYTAAAAQVIQHKPGPYRDFVYAASLPEFAQLPITWQENDRFFVFKGEII